jgi:hypothetical protein
VFEEKARTQAAAFRASTGSLAPSPSENARKQLLRRAARSPARAAASPQLDRIRVGRVKTGNAVCVKDPSVSQKHAELVWTGACWEVADLNSSNGSTLNGVELSSDGAPHVHFSKQQLRSALSGAGEPVALQDGDTLSLGDSTVFRVTLHSREAQSLGGGLTVEAFLQGECEAAVQRMQRELEAQTAALQEEAEEAIREIEVEAALTA